MGSNPFNVPMNNAKRGLMRRGTLRHISDRTLDSDHTSATSPVANPHLLLKDTSMIIKRDILRSRKKIQTPQIILT